MPPAIPHVKSGELLGLAVTAVKRSELAPNTPTMAEAGYLNLEADAWYALLGPKGVPAALVTKLNSVLNEVLALPAVKSQFINMGAEVRSSNPQAMAKLLAEDSKRYKELLEQLGLVK